MRIERQGDITKLVLGPGEVALLTSALERATFVDTPVTRQAAIAGFCEATLEALKKSGTSTPTE